MCGIVGYIGQKNAISIVMSGLYRLEYRGYDSAGVAYILDNQLHVQKKSGKVSVLNETLSNNLDANIAPIAKIIKGTKKNNKMKLI